MATNDKRIVLVILTLFLTSAALGRNALTVRWGHQLVTDTNDVARAAVVGSDGGIYFAVKQKSKDASGSASRGVFLLKYSQEGDQLWSKELEPGVADTTGLTADDKGNIYFTGVIDSTDERETKGGFDAYFAKYDKAGTQLWARQLGTPKKRRLLRSGL